MKQQRLPYARHRHHQLQRSTEKETEILDLLRIQRVKGSVLYISGLMVGYLPPPGIGCDSGGRLITKNFSEVRWARNMALLNMALMDAAIVC